MLKLIPSETDTVRTLCPMVGSSLVFMYVRLSKSASTSLSEPMAGIMTKTVGLCSMMVTFWSVDSILSN